MEEVFTHDCFRMAFNRVKELKDSLGNECIFANVSKKPELYVNKGKLTLYLL